MECLIVQINLASRGVKPKSSFTVAEGFTGSPFNSTFGNSHKCAFTTPAGLCRTKNVPFFSTTNAANRRAVAAARFSRFGNSLMRLFLKAKQSFETGHTKHFGSRGVQ